MATEILEARAVVIERADSPTGFVLQIITPGIGSSGYYSAAVLESAVTDNVFPKGTHLYVDHPSQSESQDRPERSIRDLAGSTKGDAVWNPITQAVEAACKVYPHYGWISDVAEDIGMSIRASADVSEAVIEGRKMPVIDKLIEAYSVDFVTKAGRGGKVLAAIESARQGLADADAATSAVGVAELPAVTASGRDNESEETLVPPVQESAEIVEATKRVEAAEAKAAAAEARAVALEAQLAERDNRDAALAKATARLGARFDHLPTVKARVIEAATRTLPIKDGTLDVGALEVTTDSVAEAETAYLKAALGSGAMSGHGQTQPVTASESTRTTNAWGRPIMKEA